MCLNQRFNNLIVSYPGIYLDFESIPIENFLTFCCQLNQLTAINDLFKNEFSRIKLLKITNIDVSPLSTIIFGRRTNLCETLERLTYQQEIDSNDNIERFCTELISSKMKSLKYLHLSLCSKPSTVDENPYYHSDSEDDENFIVLSLFNNQKSLSNLETIVIGDIPDKSTASTNTRTTLSFKSMVENLLPYVPKLKNLSISSIFFYDNDNRKYYKVPSSTKTDLLVPVNLKVVNLWIDKSDNKKKNRKLLRDFFGINNSTDMTTIKIFKINNKNVLEEQFFILVLFEVMRFIAFILVCVCANKYKPIDLGYAILAAFTFIPTIMLLIIEYLHYYRLWFNYRPDTLNKLKPTYHPNHEVFLSIGSTNNHQTSHWQNSRCGKGENCSSGNIYHAITYHSGNTRYPPDQTTDGQIVAGFHQTSHKAVYSIAQEEYSSPDSRDFDKSYVPV
ncbi:unnamed protein product [Rotaria sordida]|uniref:Uncharacterized protein n=3 Tax=Rotaria sordida TaxID=392033 RepID=A0A819D1L8_9BILA|nr:unnamed protein product [Rotaria sordida]